MKAKDLRIGNIVETPNNEFAVIAEIIEKNGDHGIRTECQKSTGYYLMHDGKELVKPVKITEEILLKFGLKKEDNSYKIKYLGRFVFFEKSFGFYPTAYIKNAIHYKLQYIHQLQNLCFALTGEELVYYVPTNQDVNK